MSLQDEARALSQIQLNSALQAPLYLVREPEGVRLVGLAEGYVPLLLDYTMEDHEAKGLRAFVEGQEKHPPVHFSAVERVDQAPMLLLEGLAGRGKSTFARHLTAHLAGHWLGHERFNPHSLQCRVPRNEQGLVREQAWTSEVPLPLYWHERQADLFGDEHGFAHRWLREGYPLLLILDDAHTHDAERLFADLQALGERYPSLRLLLLADPLLSSHWSMPAGWQRHQLLPLLRSQRQAFVQPRWPALAQYDAPWLGTPAAFGLALASGPASGELDLAEHWYRLFCAQPQPHQGLLENRYLQHLLVASELRGCGVAELAKLLADAPLRLTHPLYQLGRQQLLDGQPLQALVHALLQPPTTAAGVLLAAAWYEQWPVAPNVEHLRPALLALLADPSLSLGQRVAAGQALARWGDPRDLLELCSVEAGVFTMGSGTHANSLPLHTVRVEAFQIGRFPVTNVDYLKFVQATQRAWRSQTGREPQYANAPAVDLTWHDARAFCEWLTAQWREQGRIGATQRVRLPTEAEWEYAARGHQAGDGYVYPWSGDWQAGHSNGEEAGLNDTCAVGLFPLARSLWGCEDLCGQVWEWTSTLWGEDMARPSWAYPYADDGRDNPQALASVRRVLRGGCFSSPREKANVSYRGSLEPAGFWRGNGFRVVLGQ